MNCQELSTLKNIHTAGKKEFLEKGFKSASLRNIVKMAGVTTGAFYGYYNSKEELFSALVREQYIVIMRKYKEAQEVFAKLPPEQQADRMEEISGDCMDWMVEYVYEHFEECKLLICCSEGTQYENMIHEMVEIEVKSTHDFIHVLKGLGQEAPLMEMEPELEHMLTSGMFSAFFEMVVHDMPKEKAVKYVRQMRAFYTAGWKEIIGF